MASFRRKRPLPEYRPPDGSYRATAAPLARRFVGGLVDWTIVTVFFLIAQIPLGLFQATADEVGGVLFGIVFALTQAAGLAIVAGYFAFFFYTGHTLGMRAADIHVVAARSGLGTADNPRARLRRDTGLSPSAYRRRFEPADGEAVTT